MSKVNNNLNVIPPTLDSLIQKEFTVEIKEEEEKIPIRLQLIQLNPDPQQFKPYSPQLKPPENQPIQVQMEILKRYVKDIKEDGTIVLSPLGLAKIAQIMCTVIIKIHVVEE
jgi:hypothetical protein